MTNAQRRIPQLDGLRGIAILMVFATHALKVPLLWMGVDLFFVLSGFLITNILLRLKENHAAGEPYWSSFYGRRMRRILPAYVGFLLVLTCFYSVPWKQIWYWYIFFAANVPVALGTVKIASLSPLWSLAVEEQFYLVWPWLVLFCRTRTLIRITIAVMVACPLLRAACTPVFATHFPIYSLTMFRADTLAAGAFIALSARADSAWLTMRQRAAGVIFIFAIVLLAGLSTLPRFRTSANDVLFNALGYSLSALLFASSLMIVLSRKRGIACKILHFRPLRYLGLISYTFYLYHELVLMKLREFISSDPWVAGLGFGITAVISVLSWHYFEFPILNMGKDLISASLRLIPAKTTSAGMSNLTFPQPRLRQHKKSAIS